MSSAATSKSSSNTLMTIYKWLTIITALGILVQAILASQGVFGGHRSLISDHGQFGNGLFLLVVIQAFLSFQLSNTGYFSRSILAFNVVQILLVVAQIGLGYGSRSNTSVVAWHIPNGVLLMGTCTMLAVLAWFRTSTPSPATTSSR